MKGATTRFPNFSYLALLLVLPLISFPARADNEMLDADNLKSLGCVAPNTDFQVLKVGKPVLFFIQVKSLS